MTASKSMPSPAAAPAQSSTQAPAPKPETQSELIDRLATEMRTKSGGELPLSFCIEQVKAQMSGKSAARPSTADRPPVTANPPGGSVFHSWALPD